VITSVARLDKELKLQASNPSGPSGVKGLGQPDKQTADEAVWLGVGHEQNLPVGLLPWLHLGATGGRR
jgi:hypothetical protein